MDEILKKAEAFAREKHNGQVDKSGAPYIEHPIAVASKLDGEIEKVVAMLHDTVEDTSATIEEIRSEFGNEVADAVDVLTHDKGVSYMEYIRGIWKNSLARKVKMADLEHNMDLSRLSSVGEADLKRLEKYKAAYKILEDK